MLRYKFHQPHEMEQNRRGYGDGIKKKNMMFPQPPWNLFGVYRPDEIEQLKATLDSAKVPFDIKHEPNEPKPYCVWVHDDHLQAASDAIGPLIRKFIITLPKKSQENQRAEKSQ